MSHDTNTITYECLILKVALKIFNVALKMFDQDKDTWTSYFRNAAAENSHMYFFH